MEPTAYYNENDPKAAAWLRELIRDGLIMDGEVDDRSITDVKGSDLEGFTRCHFFAGIGGWDYALQLAGWPSGKPVWTGSCPCQPFSVAGKGKGTADERHLWPEFARLIGERSPAAVFGEQVASKAGRAWLAGVQTDLEGMGYRTAGADLCAAGVGAPHIRQRLWWVGHAEGKRESQISGFSERPGTKPGRIGRLGYSGCPTNERWGGPEEAPGTAGEAQREGDQRERGGDATGSAVKAGGMADTNGRDTSTEGIQRSGEHGQQSQNGGTCFWSDTYALECRDGKTRRIPTEPALFPLVDGFPERVGILRGSGNAIVPQVAAEFIEAIAEIL